MVGNGLQAVMYTVQDQRVLETGRFDTGVNVLCTDPILWPVRWRVRLNYVTMLDRLSLHYM